MNKLKLLIGTIILSSIIVSCSNDKNSIDKSNENNIQIQQNNFTKNLSIPKNIKANENYILTAQNLTTSINGKNIKVLGYTENGILGPTIIAQKGDDLNITLKNKLTEETNIHWHGLLAPSKMDGYPSNVIKEGDSFNYSFKINQRAGMYWYHPHPHGKTSKQAYLGLAGVFIVNDDEEKKLNLPSGNYEIPLVIQDKKLNENSLDYNPNMNDVMTGFMGKDILINGELSPNLNVSTRYYRFRILNGSNARVYNLAFSNNAKFSVIGSDGGLLSKAEEVSSLLLSPGERADILVDFSKYEIGSETYLQSNIFEGSLSQGKEAFKILKLSIKNKEENTFKIPEKLSNIDIIPTSSSVKTRIFDINGIPMMGNTNQMNHGSMNIKNTMGMAMHTINKKVFDINRIDEIVKAGSNEIWEFDNSTGDEIHSMHLHNVQFQVLERSGARNNLLAIEKGFKDTILLMPKEKVKIIINFPENKGKYLVHCHNLEHEDDGMMLNFMIE